MGKNLKKSKISGDTAVMDVPHSSLGVRTRAKTLPLQQPPDVSYLQLRSRRLHKPHFPPPKQFSNDPASQLRNRRSSSELGSPLDFGKGAATQPEEVDDFGLEASFGEDNLEFDATARSTRESTWCSLKRDLEGIGTPGSAVRSTCSGAVNERRVQVLLRRSSPSTREMEDFFATAERQQQKQFMDKYNFDVVNGLPLLGQYEWVRVGL